MSSEKLIILMAFMAFLGMVCAKLIVRLAQ
jgi:hypothetical protein